MSGGGKTQTNTVTQDIPAYMRGGQEQLIGAATNLAFNPNMPMTPRTNYTQNSALGQMLDTGNRIQGIADNTWAPVQSSMGFLLDPNNLRIDANPYAESYTNAATRGITDNFTQNVLPNLRSEAINSGQYGSSRHDLAEGAATKAYLTSLGDTYATIANDMYGHQLGGMVAATQMAPAYGNQTLAMADAQAQYLANAGNYQQQIESNNISDPWNRLEWLRGFYPNSPGGSTRSVGAAPYINPWLGTAGGAAAGASAGASMGGSTGGYWGAGIGALLGYLGSRQ